MFIVIHCMGMPFDGSTIESESLGGSETAAYYMAKELVNQGHSVTIFTICKKEEIYDGVKYVPVGEVSQEQPLGSNFHFYAQNTPHDVLIIQRHPQAFAIKYASKINLWWTHDLALLRMKDVIIPTMWNIDGVLTVSEYHKKQVCHVYGFDPKIVMPITNGVNLDLYRHVRTRKMEKPYQLLYSSRPERGLGNLVKDGGIMDQLGEDYQLRICAYKNTTAEMEPHYQYLIAQCEKKQNVINAGALAKQELAYRQLESDLLVYPTEFEEVSCITAMEAMAAGLPMISSQYAALVETCGEGTILLPLKDGKVDCGKFTKRIRKMFIDRLKYSRLSSLQKQKSTNYSWDQAVKRLLDVIEPLLGQDAYSNLSIANRCIDNSDIVALEEFRILIDKSPLSMYKYSQKSKLYKFAFENNFKQHYEDYYEYEKARGVEYGPESLEGNTRFECVANVVAVLPDGGTIMDYGCAHGHYTINLAKRFPNKNFIGIDIAGSNIEKAKAWTEREGIRNAKFYQGSTDSAWFHKLHKYGVEAPALIIAAEILEHVWDIQELVINLIRIATQDTKFVITTPYGPWEAEGYTEHHPWRAHLHHLERKDLHDLWGHFDDFKVTVIPAGIGRHGDIMGSYMTEFKWPADQKQGKIDYDRKLSLAVGKPTISLCMIARDAQNTIAQTIESVIGIVDEVIVMIDDSTIDNTQGVINQLRDKYPLIMFHWESIESPLKLGFDEARNISISNANGDWILWLDADEIVTDAEQLSKYLKNNQYNGFAIKQHHFSVNPLGVIKTDLPVRIFRNRKGIKFFGVVHEHPELELNKGVGYALVLNDVDIAHHGYPDEATRKKRFERNISLMRRDRELYPNRILGKSLWVRDLTQSIKFELMAGVPENQSMYDRAGEGIELWRELLDDSPRMAADMLDYYSVLVKMKNIKGSLDYSFALAAQPINGRDISIESAEKYQGTFLNIDHARAFFKKIEQVKIENIDSEYL